MKKLFFLMFLFPVLAFADALSDLPGQIQGAAIIDPATFSGQVIIVVQHLGGLPWVAKIAFIVLLLISAMKVSALDDLIFNRLGKFKAMMAPILGLVFGLLMLGKDGGLSLAGIFAYMASGAGAILLHELLDMIKGIPGLGTGYIAAINVIEGALGGNPN